MFAIFGTLIAMILTAFGVYFVANLLSVNVIHTFNIKEK